jgi:hypothetical protein
LRDDPTSAACKSRIEVRAGTTNSPPRPSIGACVGLPD